MKKFIWIADKFHFLKKWNFYFSLCIFHLSLFTFHFTSAQTTSVTRILFLVDVSNSMNQQWSGASRMDNAKKIVSEIIDTLKRKPNIELALRVYGTESVIDMHDCNDTKLLVPFAKDNIPQLKEAIANLHPKGITPISLSLEKAAGDFPQDPNSRNILILITDGEESCNADPCAVSLALQKSGAFLKPFIIGLREDKDIVQKLQCMGAFYNADDPVGFKDAMLSIITLALSPTYIQVNLMDRNNKPSETDAVMTFYDNGSGAIRYNYMHTINYKGTPDTVNLDPVSSYNLVVQTTPPIEKKDIALLPKNTNIISLDAAQGYLFVNLKTPITNSMLSNKIKCLVKVHDQYGTVDVQDLNTTEKYLCGKYDLEFLTLPRTQLYNVDVSQSKTTSITIPSPGIVTIQKSVYGYGGILWFNGTSWEKIYTLSEKSGVETVALQPGTYKVVFRSKSSKKTSDTQEQKIIITSGGTATAKF